MGAAKDKAATTMTSARYSQVTDELLSAYLDDAVTPEERRWVEAAVADDPGVAWRLESLRTTVQLLHELPALALPRSFVLSPEQIQANQLAPAVAIAPAPVLPTTTPVRTPGNEGGFWARFVEGWQRFWAPGNPVFRNAMAASFAALLFLMIVPGLLAPVPQSALPTTANVSSAEVADTVAAVAPAERAQMRTDAEVQLRRAAPQPTAVPTDEALAIGLPPATSVPVTQDTPAIVTLGSASSAREAAGSDTVADGVSSLSIAQAAPPGPRDDVLAEAAAAAPPMAAAAPVSMAPVSDSAVSAMTMDANVVSATPGAPAEGVAFYAPEVAGAAALSAPAAAAKLAVETEPASEIETFSALESAELASSATAAATGVAADQVVAGDVAAAPVAPAAEQPAQPSATAPAPTSVPVAAAQVAPEEPVSIAPAPEPSSNASSNSIWVWLQVAAALGVLGFGILWWRTRPS
ncbi:MAG: zf-HC2 domain-containing protein [Anaerolineales bacterium]|nr:zf-HC2 domain-containing protein [Anaerolineales bacterium]